MEAPAAFGLACNVVQTIAFAKEAVGTCRQIYKHGASVDNENLKRRSQQLRIASERVVSWKSDLAGQEKELTTADSQLHDVSKSCIQTVELLEKELQKLQRDKRDGRLVAMSQTLRTLKSKGKIERIEATLGKLQNTLDTSILVQLRFGHLRRVLLLSD